MDRVLVELLDHEPGRELLMRTRPRSTRGFGLIELMVGITILAILTLLAAPWFGDWTRNTRLRSAAETLRSDLQMARAEAIRRNTGTRLQFVSSLDASCALSTSVAIWVVNSTLSQTPADACGNTPSTTSTPYLIGKSPLEVSKSSDLVLTATRSTVGFDALGRQSATTNPTTSIAALTVQLSSASGTCVASGGSVRCLNVIVSPGGDSRICDPARSGTTDPMTC
ncbi:GspH/FimT family pseudopilin [Variovorax sp. W6]|uniref:GspH/FimT family pseudopilin n=1 Tax=Variovorax sp. W6 TaxID=3093895 RepID=UPI003D8041CC